MTDAAEMAEVVEKLRLLADGCDVSGLDHLPVVSRANAAEFAADLRALLAHIALLEAENKALREAAAEPWPAGFYHHRRHPWAQPGDEPNRVWRLRFDDADMREMVWTGEDAEAEAKAAYATFCPTWNCYLFATVRTSLALSELETLPGLDGGRES